jgi:hypothetical protein
VAQAGGMHQRWNYKVSIAGTKAIAVDLTGAAQAQDTYYGGPLGARQQDGGSNVRLQLMPQLGD